MNSVRRTSLLKIVFFIVSITLTFVVALIAVLFSIFGHGLYVNYKTDDLLPKAKALSNQVTKLYLENADRHTISRLIYSEEYAVAETSVYLIESYGSPISNDDAETQKASAETVRICFESVMEGKTVSMPQASAGIVVGVPVYDGADRVIAAVILIHRGSVIQDRVNGLALQFGLVMIAILLVALIPAILVFRYVTKPIKAVSETALAMANGDLDARAVPRGSYESQHLAESFNTLADALRSNIDHLVIERNRLGTVLDGIGEGIIAVDRQGDITHYNSAAIRLLGGSDSSDPASLSIYPKVADVAAHALESNARSRAVLGVSDRLLRVSSTPIYEANDTLCGAVTLISDITESERLEQTRRDYVANVSHELRTPLASIRSLSDALCDGIITDEEDKQRYYGYIQRESIRLSHLIDDLLELSRLQSGGVAFSKMRVELFEIAYDVADRMNEMAHQRGKSVRLEMPEGRYFASTNADRIEQVLIALTDNAIKHGIDGCCVSIDLRLCEDGKRYLFSVSNPAEIDPTDIEHIFERFYKADHAHSGEGTGLGLAIVSEILNLLNERINVVYSEGSIRFTFTVERDASDGEHPELSPCGCSEAQRCRQIGVIESIE
ncbi:MAG: HAMP domain-containing protein [Clostridia bacterium]|nr:HAMP domain-containing protein [Clostridia bacterium]